MSNSERLDVLRAAKELGGRTDAQFRRLLPFVDEVSVPPGTVIAEAGRLCHQLVIVASGMLETCRNGRSGCLGPGDVFGWNAMRERGAYDATVQSVSPARLLVMSHEQFRAAEPMKPQDRSRTAGTSGAKFWRLIGAVGYDEGKSVHEPAARECIIPAPPASDRRKHTATHIR